MPAPGWKKKTKSPSGVGLALVNVRKTAHRAHEEAENRLEKHVLESVLETRDLDEVMERAELAGRVFAAENPVPRVLIDSEVDGRNPSEAGAARQVEEAMYKDSLTVPRRPKWNPGMTAEELDVEERRAFLSWRRGLARLEANESLVLTPFEKNLDVWRQLWRVLERSDLVVVVVDARNPLFYRCPDLEAYIRELGGNKESILLLNKADLLSTASRREWASYLKTQGLSFLFWSAKEAASILEGKAVISTEAVVDEYSKEEGDDDIRVLGRDELLNRLQEEAEAIVELQKKRAGASLSEHVRQDSQDSVQMTEDNTGGLGIPERKACSNTSRRVVVGFVGYPNVGKSSTINALAGEKKTGVTSTPGKTKHFQTLIISEQLMLCDCPGLVFPSFSSSKSEMVASGVLPIDKLSDHRGPVQVVADNVPRSTLEEVYRISLPMPKLYEAQARPPSAAEVLFVIAVSRGYFSNGGLPDETRVARLILKDYLSGKLPFCHSPPTGTSVSSDEATEGIHEILSGEDSDQAGNVSDGESLEETREIPVSRTSLQEEQTNRELSTMDGEAGEISANLLGVVDQTGDNLARVFADLDTSVGNHLTRSAKEEKARGAAHKLHKKAARRKDRTWRAGRMQSMVPPVVNGVKVPVSYGAADRYQVQVFE